MSWFGPKRLGIGIGPKRWQGWVVLFVYIVLASVLPRNYDITGGRLWGFHATLLALLFMVIYMTYDHEDDKEEGN
jgi:hypothetical protein